jgi:hypothetical protein
MTERTAFIMIVTGLIFTMFGVGGIEQSITDSELLASLAVSVVGMGIMYSGTVALRVSDSYR